MNSLWLAGLLLANLCGDDAHHVLRLSNPAFAVANPMQPVGYLRLLFDSFEPYEFLYKTDKNKPYHVRIRLPDFIFNNNGYKPDTVIPECTAVG